MPISKEARPNGQSRSARTAPKPRGAGAKGKDVRKEIESILSNAQDWLNTGNDLFGGRTPAELIGTKEEGLLWQWVAAVKHGSLP